MIFMSNLILRLAVLSFILGLNFANASSQQTPATREFAVEVFQVLEMPLTVTNAALVKTKGGYLLKCSLSNSSEFRQLGSRYSLAIVNSMNVTTAIVTRNEGFKLPPYQTKIVTFRIPAKLNLKGDERLVLMLEQAVSTDYIWEVVKSKESLGAYMAGDYSITPRVLRVSN